MSAGNASVHRETQHHAIKHSILLRSASARIRYSTNTGVMHCRLLLILADRPGP